MVCSATPVFQPKRTQSRLVESAFGCAGIEDSLCKTTKAIALAQPGWEWHAKPGFSPVYDFIWKIVSSDALYQLFATQELRSTCRRHGVGELRDTVVQERDSRLYAGTHAHFVLAIQN